MCKKPFQHTLSLTSARISFLKGRRALSQFHHSRQKRHLEACIEHYRHACECIEEQHDTTTITITPYSSYLISYASAVNVYDQTFARTNRKVIQVLEKGRTLFNEKRRFSGGGQPRDYAAFLNQLGESYLNQYRRTKDDGDYRRAVGAFADARSPEVAKQGSLPFVSSLIGSAVALWTSCDLQPQFDDVRVLREAILCLEEARGYDKLDGESSSTMVEAECCLYLGMIYGHLYDPSLDSVHYLDKSIECGKRAVALFKPNTSKRATALFQLAKQQCRRYADVRKNETDLVEAEGNTEKLKDLVRRGYGTRDVREGMGDLVRYVGSCRSPVLAVADDGRTGAVELGGKSVPCSMSRYYLRK